MRLTVPKIGNKTCLVRGRFCEKQERRRHGSWLCPGCGAKLKVSSFWSNPALLAAAAIAWYLGSQIRHGLMGALERTLCLVIIVGFVTVSCFQSIALVAGPDESKALEGQLHEEVLKHKAGRLEGIAVAGVIVLLLSLYGGNLVALLVRLLRQLF